MEVLYILIIMEYVSLLIVLYILIMHYLVTFYFQLIQREIQVLILLSLMEITLIYLDQDKILLIV